MFFLKDIANDIYKKRSNFDDIFICFHAHILYSSLSFFETLIELGFKKENIFILGKSYSTVPEIFSYLQKNSFNVFHMDLPSCWGDYERVSYLAAKTMIQQLFKTTQKSSNPKIIVMDSGAALTQAVSEILLPQEMDVIGVELTTQGTYSEYRYPVIEVAISKAKRELESNFIAASIFNALDKRHLIKKEFTYGVLGGGAIGNSLLDFFSKKGLNIICYDLQQEKVPPVFFRSLKMLLKESDCLIGTTGVSSLTKEMIADLKEKVILVSASSKDTEFSNFLTGIKVPFNPEKPFDDFTFNISKKKSLFITNGTFPINFDRVYGKNLKGDPEIMLTRGLWLAGLFQALLTSSDEKPFNIQLEIPYQVSVVQNWKHYFGSNFSKKRLQQINGFLKKMKE